MYRAKPLDIKRPTYEKLSPSTEYWRRFRSPVTCKETSAVQYLSFSPISPYDLAVTTSTKVHIYNSASAAIKKAVAHTQTTAYSGNYRPDGKLLVTGDESGSVFVYDVETKRQIRKFEGHLRPTRLCLFIGQQTVLSGSDDCTARIWDLASGLQLACLAEHTDHIRTAVACPEFLVTGSYDHTVKFWDRETNACILTMDHGDPVECLILHPNGKLVFSAGGNTIKVWDLHSKGRLLRVLQNHQKTVTSLCIDSAGQHLLSGSLDHHLKVYTLSNLKVVYSSKYPSAVLSIAMSPTDTQLVVGMSSGILSIRKKPLINKDILMQAEAHENYNNYKFVIRGKNATTAQEDFKVESTKHHRLKKYDKLLAAYRYREALDAALNTGDALVTITLLEEFVHRGVLKNAISDRVEADLVNFVSFINAFLSTPQFTRLLIDVSHIVLDVYSGVAKTSLPVRESLQNLQTKLQRMTDQLNEFTRLLGTLDLILANSSVVHKHNLASADCS